ncbi:MAG: 3-oxoacyl-ACP synthase [Gammaproteobacteria bacterium]|nr:3-oxoacyl-ACP synthase [Gammaproteobacteria bacterium]
MSTKKRVFITGRGAVTASGMTADATWDAVLNGQQALGDLKLWDIESWSHRLVGELQDYHPASMLPDRKLLKVISRQDVTGISAGMQAIEQSALLSYRDQLSAEAQTSFAEDSAVYVGSPGNKYFQQYDFLPLMAKAKGDMQVFAKELFSEVHPMWLLRILPNNVLAYLGITYGFKGVNHNITNHAVSGMQALLEAYEAIASGQAKRALVVAYDIGTDPQALYYYEKLGLLSARDLQPFDAEHDGTILAEGASALVLESEDAVQERSATCLAEVMGGCTATESQGLFSIEPQGLPLQQLLNQTLQRCDLSPEDLGAVIAHGNGSHLSDVTEAQALAAVLAETSVPVTAFKWSMGHTLCASGLLDTVLGSYAMQANCVPGISNLQSVSTDCATLNVHQEARAWSQDKDHLLIINRGFAGMNACVVLRACR